MLSSNQTGPEAKPIFPLSVVLKGTEERLDRDAEQKNGL